MLFPNFRGTFLFITEELDIKEPQKSPQAEKDIDPKESKRDKLEDHEDNENNIACVCDDICMIVSQSSMVGNGQTEEAAIAKKDKKQQDELLKKSNFGFKGPFK